MDKFWGGVAVVLAFALAFVAVSQDQSGINFTDLETECRYDRSQDIAYTLDDRKLQFSGQYPVKNPDSMLDHRYQVSGDTIKLEIESSQSPYPSDYWNDCKGIVVYEADSGQIDPGEYTLKIVHDGEEVKEDVIEIN